MTNLYAETITFAEFKSRYPTAGSAIERSGVVVQRRLPAADLYACDNEDASFRLDVRAGGDTLTTVVRAEGGRLVDFYPDCPVYAQFLRRHEGEEVQFVLQERT